MAEVVATISTMAAVCNIISGITKVVTIIAEVTTKWKDADLTLLCLSSQLTALRSALSEIQAWINYSLKDAHYQLIMDLDISISCCKVLMDRLESLFSPLADFVDQPLDFRKRFKIAFGGVGPQAVQKLIAHQTSALTLLLTACNCKTLSEQQCLVERPKTQKALKRIQADSESLCVLRDSSSLASRYSDTLSMISRVFDFDSSIFSTRVYEQAFRGSFKHTLKQRQSSQPLVHGTCAERENMYALGHDEVGKDQLLNAILGRHPQRCTVEVLEHCRLELQKRCVELICAIIKRDVSLWDSSSHIAALLAYDSTSTTTQSEFTIVLHTCNEIWCSTLRSSHEPDPILPGCVRETIRLRDMTFYVDITPLGRLHLYCGNSEARFFLYRMERMMPNLTVELRNDQVLPSDYLRALPTLEPDQVFNCKIEGGPRLVGQAAGKLPSASGLQNARSINYIFDLQDYSSPTSDLCYELQRRLDFCMLETANLGDRDLPEAIYTLVILTNSSRLRKQLASRSYQISSGQRTNEFALVVQDIESRFRGALRLHINVAFFDEDDVEASRAMPIECFDRVVAAMNVRPENPTSSLNAICELWM